MINQGKRQIVIRIGKHHLSFSSINLLQAENPITYEPYVMKSSMSVAANLREALKGAETVETNVKRALVMVDAPILLMPIELFEEQTMEELYLHSYPSEEQLAVLYNVLPDLNTVAVFAIARDLVTVLTDNFDDVKFTATMSPVWRHLHKRSFTGMRSKLYGYFHDQKLEIFSFYQNRFKFYNQFEAARARDAIYFLLYVWKQLALDAEQDEMYLVGELPEREWLAGEVKRYLQKAYVINPAADFNRAPATQVKDMPYDLVTYYAKGR